MNRQSIRSFLPIALVLALALPIAALAWPGGDRDRGERMQQKLDQLELDSDTRAQVEGILQDGLEQRREGKQALREAKKQMHELMRSATASEAELVAQSELVAELELEARKARITRHLALRDLLTQEQLETLHPRKHHGGRGEGGEKGDCDGKRRHSKRFER